MKVLLKTIVDYAGWVHVAGVLVILLCLRSVFLARRERDRSIYSLEKEAATGREFRVLTIGMITGLVMGLAFFLTAVVAPRVTFVEPEAEPAEATPVAALVLPTVTPTRARATATPTTTPTRIRPTLPPPTLSVPFSNTVTITDVATSTPAPTPVPLCPNPLARLTSPQPGGTASKAVQILGTANTPDFDYYKLEYSTTGRQDQWAVVTDLHRRPVESGLLDVWDTSALPNGVYNLRLVVVDKTGNYPLPCSVRVNVSN
jgi:hypothetical protein